VRVIDPEGQQLGVLPLQQAISEAQALGLDLIEVAPQATPPVCRIMDWGKFRYEQQKKARESHKRTRQVELKGIRIRPNTDEHDIQFKMRNARRFLMKGDKVKFNVIFRGPELRHRKIGERQLQRFIDGLRDVAQVSQAPHMEGRQMIMILEPRAEVLADLQARRSGRKRKADDGEAKAEEREGGDEAFDEEQDEGEEIRVEMMEEDSGEGQEQEEEKGEAEGVAQAQELEGSAPAEAEGSPPELEEEPGE